MEALKTATQHLVEPTSLPWLFFSTLLGIIVGFLFFNLFSMPKHHNTNKKSPQKSKKQSKQSKHKHNPKDREELCADCYVDDVMNAYEKPNELIAALEKELRRALNDFSRSEGIICDNEAYIRDLEKMNDEYVAKIKELEKLAAAGTEVTTKVDTNVVG